MVLHAALISASYQIQENLLHKFHRTMFCWQDEWHGMTEDDIRAYEDKLAEEMNLVSCNGALCPGTLREINFSKCNSSYAFQFMSCCCILRRNEKSKRPLLPSDPTITNQINQECLRVSDQRMWELYSE